MRCPILITGRIPRVIYRGDFVRQLQEKLAQLGHDPGPVDGLYGPRTAVALQAFQASRADTLQDQAWSQVLQIVQGGVGVAACATYRALGLPCEEVYCDIGMVGAWLGDSGKATAVCTGVALAADQGVIRLRCNGGGRVILPSLPPTTPLPGGLRVPTWAVIGAGVVVAGGLAFLIVKGVRR